MIFVQHTVFITDLKSFCCRCRKINIFYILGRIILDGGRYHILRGSDGSTSADYDLQEGRLILRQVTEADYGQYGCRADNPLGSDYAFIHLRPRGIGFLEGDLLYAVVGAGLVCVILVIVFVSVPVCRALRRRRQAKRAEGPQQKQTSEAPILKKNGGGAGGEAATTYSRLAPDLLDSLMNSSGGGGTREPLLPHRSSAIISGRQLNSLLPANAGYYGNAQLTGRPAYYDEEDEGRGLSRSSSQSTLPPGSSVSGGGGGRRLASRRSLSPLAQQQQAYIMGDSSAVDYSTSSTMSSVLSRGSRSNR